MSIVPLIVSAVTQAVRAGVSGASATRVAQVAAGVVSGAAGSEAVQLVRRAIMPRAFKRRRVHAAARYQTGRLSNYQIRTQGHYGAYKKRMRGPVRRRRVFKRRRTNGRPRTGRSGMVVYRPRQGQRAQMRVMSSRVPNRPRSSRTMRQLFRTGQHLTLQYFGNSNGGNISSFPGTATTFGAVKCFGIDGSSGVGLITADPDNEIFRWNTFEMFKHATGFRHQPAERTEMFGRYTNMIITGVTWRIRVQDVIVSAAGSGRGLPLYVGCIADKDKAKIAAWDINALRPPFNEPLRYRKLQVINPSGADQMTSFKPFNMTGHINYTDLLFISNKDRIGNVGVESTQGYHEHLLKAPTMPKNDAGVTELPAMAFIMGPAAYGAEITSLKMQWTFKIHCYFTEREDFAIQVDTAT